MDNSGSPRITPLVKQTWMAAGALLTVVAQGMAQGFISVLLVALQKPDAPFKVDVRLTSWMVSGMALSVIVGIFVSSSLMDILGRKTTFILGVLPGVAAICVMYAADSFTIVLVSRLLDGLCAGGTVPLCAIIIGEYVDPKYRGMLLNLKSALICLGSTIAHCLGYWLHWRTVILIPLIFYGLSLLIVCTWPESPSWLATQKRFKKSEEIFLWLRGDTATTRAELNELIEAQKQRPTTLVKTSITTKLKVFFVKWKRRDYLQSLAILVSSHVILEASGRHLIPAYCHQIVTSFIINRDLSLYYTLTVDTIVTISALCSSVLVRYVKVRTLFFSSGVVSISFLFIACLYLFLVSQSIISKDMPLIPLAFFIMYLIVINLGCTPLSLALIGEVVPLEHKAQVVAAASIINCSILITILKMFPYLMLHLYVYGTFFVLGFVIVVMLIILYFILPETKNRTLQEIENQLKYGEVRMRSKVEEDDANIQLNNN